jgi:protein-disulfide isomerase
MADVHSTHSGNARYVSGWHHSLDVLATVSMLLASVTFIWAILTGLSAPSTVATQSRGSSVLPNRLVDLMNRATVGSPQAPVGVIMYSDFECPFCGRFARQTLPVIMTDYVSTGKVTLGFRHFPLKHIHPNARDAAEAAECAGIQGRFWEMHDALFREPKELTRDKVLTKADKIGLNVGSFEKCLRGETAARVDADFTEARQMEVRGTPTFFFGTLQAGKLNVIRRETGALPASAFTEILDELLPPK